MSEKAINRVVDNVIYHICVVLSVINRITDYGKRIVSVPHVHVPLFIYLFFNCSVQRHMEVPAFQDSAKGRQKLRSTALTIIITLKLLN